MYYIHVTSIPTYRVYHPCDEVAMKHFSFVLQALQFEELLANNMDILNNSSDMTADDIVQVGLLYPQKSEVFLQAQKIANEEKHKMWINWT